MTNLKFAKRNSIKALIATVLVSAMLTGTAFATSNVNSFRKVSGGKNAPTARPSANSAEAHLKVTNHCHHDVYIAVDGIRVGEVKDGTSMEIQVLPGAHVVEAQETKTNAKGSSRINLVEREHFTWALFDR